MKIHLSSAELVALSALAAKHPESNVTLQAIGIGVRVEAIVWDASIAAEVERVVLGQ